MGEFVFLYRGGIKPPASPAEGQQNMAKWMAWFQELAAKGHVIDRGQPLENSGKLVRARTKTITDGPFAELKDVVGGFTLIKARDIDEAAQIAKSCPILDRDGDVEVRPVMKMDM